jgi:AcrR family transcriptional regulator
MPKVNEEHRELRRPAILDAALTCFDRRGLHGTTMQDIVAESGLSAGAIYTYFESKNAIIAAIAADRHAGERELLDAALAIDDPRAAVHAFVNGFFDWFTDADEQRRRRVNVYVWAEALHSPEVGTIVSEGIAPIAEVTVAIEAAARAGRFPEHIDPESFARAIVALIQGFVLQQAWDPAVDVDRFRATALTMIDALLSDDLPRPIGMTATG